MISHARAELPAECCGLLSGRVPIANEVQADIVVERCYRLGNKLGSPTEFESDSRSMIDAARDMRECGTDMIAIYHSHPCPPPYPSRKDLERNFYGDSVVHLIISLAGAMPEVRGWWLHEADYETAEWEVTSRLGAATPAPIDSDSSQD